MITASHHKPPYMPCGNPHDRSSRYTTNRNGGWCSGIRDHDNRGLDAGEDGFAGFDDGPAGGGGAVGEDGVFGVVAPALDGGDAGVAEEAFGLCGQ
jgi:hypothetical protein